MNKEQTIDLPPPQNKILQKILRQHIPNKTVWAFGSRVEWKASETSDLDLVAHKCSGAEIADLKEALEESALHCSVDVLNWEDIPDSFRANIKKHYVVVQQNTVPEGWQVVKLGEFPIQIIDNDRGKNYPKEAEFYNSGHCLFLNTKNVTSKGFVFTETKFITKEKDSILRKGKLNRNDIVLTTRGTIGNIAFYDKKIPYENVRINSGMVIVRPDGIDPRFNFQLFKYLKTRFLNFSSGSAQPQIPIRDIKEVRTLLPPLSEQKAIAEVLSSLDDKIDLLRKQNKTLEDMAQTLFRKWFLEDAGDDWEIGILGDIVELETGKKVGKGQPHYLEIGDIDISTRGYDIEGKEKCTVSGAVTVPKNTLLVSKVRPTRGAITITKSEVNVSGAFTRIKFTNKYIYPCVNRASFFGYLGKVSTGSTYPTCKDSDILNYEIAIPPQKLLNAFNETVTPCFDKIQYNRLQVQHLKNLRDVLLPKLISGKIRVKQ